MCPGSFPQRSLLGPPNFGFGWAEGVPTTFTQIGQEQWKVANNEIIIIHSTGLVGKPIILEPQFGVHFPRVFWDVGWWLVPWWDGGVEDVSTEGLRSW